MFVSVRFVGPAPHPGRGLSPLHPRLTRFLPPHCPLYLHPFPSHVRLCSFRGPCPTPRQGTESPAPAPHPLPAPSLSAASPSLPLPMFVPVRLCSYLSALSPSMSTRPSLHSPLFVSWALHLHLTCFLPPHCPLRLHPSPFPCSSLFVSWGAAPRPGRGLSPLHPRLTCLLPPHCPLRLHPSPFLLPLPPFVSVRIHLPFLPLFASCFPAFAVRVAARAVTQGVRGQREAVPEVAGAGMP